MSTTNSAPLPNLEDLKLPTSSVTVSETLITPPPHLTEVIESLRASLSPKASIQFQDDAEYAINTARWSTFHPPKSGAVVNVACEADIAATVKWANQNSVALLAQSGGHGFTRTVSGLPANSVIINMRPLNNVSVSLETGTAKISGGALTSEVVAAAHEAGAHIMTGVCNSVGAVGPMLGGGIGSLMALYGMAVDNMISARLVISNGDVVTVSAQENEDLWWGLRGAGHNFGIVSELTVKAHKQVNEGIHWGGMVAFPGTVDFLEKVVSAMHGMQFGVGKPMSCFMIWAKAPPEFHPTILLSLWYGGPASIAEQEFASILSLNPVMNETAAIPYTLINSGSDFACIKNGHRRPCYAAALPSIPTLPTFLNLFQEWNDLVASDADLGHSVIITECYSWKFVKEYGGEDGLATAYPWRNSQVYMVAAPEFSNDEHEGKVVEFGRKIREIAGSGKVYVNFASGDEAMEQMYGSQDRVDRLRALKRKWDPKGAFSYYNAIR